MASTCGSVVTAAIVACAFLGCARGPDKENHVFFQNDESPQTAVFEVPFPPLDQAAHGASTAYMGVRTLGGAVQFSRPINWRIRRGSAVKGRRFVEYVSPREYLFAVYERDDDTCSSWSAILGEYEDDAKIKGLEWAGKAIPIAGFDTQGREYVVRRQVKGQKAPYDNTSREIVFRGDHSRALIEIVHQGQSDAAIEGELLRTIETLTVL